MPKHGSAIRSAILPDLRRDLDLPKGFAPNDCEARTRGERLPRIEFVGRSNRSRARDLRLIKPDCEDLISGKADYNHRGASDQGFLQRSDFQPAPQHGDRWIVVAHCKSGAKSRAEPLRAAIFLSVAACAASEHRRKIGEVRASVIPPAPGDQSPTLAIYKRSVNGSPQGRAVLSSSIMPVVTLRLGLSRGHKHRHDKRCENGRTNRQLAVDAHLISSTRQIFTVARNGTMIV
jgi:hypothetical protein